MSIRSFAPLVLLALACGGDAAPLGPGDSASPVLLESATAPSNPAQGGWSFETLAVYTQTLDPGVLRITPGNVQHWLGLVNEFQMVGDVEGLFIFDGFSRVVLREGKGPVVGKAILDITAPMVGRFECQTHGYQKNFDPVDFPGAEFTLESTFYACVGSGDYAGSKMKGTASYLTGVSPSSYEITGTIY